MKLNSRELRKIDPAEAELLGQQLQRWPLYLILENILDTYNIGGFFRLADASAITTIYLCGQTATPPDHKILKASVGTYKLVPWVYKSTAREAIAELRQSFSDIEVLVVEQAVDSVDYQTQKYRLPTALVFGNETDGVSADTLSLVEAKVEVPMYGINKSLNVMVAAGIVIYRALEDLRICEWPTKPQPTKL
jgi:tRNA G18 (ribose-2'-O)-methylase SpoU